MTDRGPASAKAEVTIDAEPAAVYDLITDLPTLASLAEENEAMKWHKGDKVAPGAVFKGTNRNGFRRWTTTCTITDADPGRAFAFDVNYFGTWLMSRAVFPTMKKQWEDKQERGAIVNISSIAGVMGVGSSIPYACSKGALNTLTLTLARWFSPAVRVNTVCPGFIQTRWLLGGMGEENYNKLKQSQEQTAPLRQAGTPEQMAEAVIFFLTSASNITGEFLIVDAGTHLGGLPMKGR